MICPSFCSIIFCRIAFVHTTVPRKPTPIIASQILSGVFLKRAGRLVAALFTRISTLLNSSMVFCTISSTSFSSATSVLMGRAFPPSALISSAVSYIVPAISRDFILVLAAIIIIAPSLANDRAIALPIPLLDPVTIATLSFNLIITLCYSAIIPTVILKSPQFSSHAHINS